MTHPIDLVFGPGGLFAQSFQGYERRPQQAAFSRAAFESMQDGQRLLADAPCGVGKSIAYLVPAIWHVTEGKQAILDWRRSLSSDDEEGSGFDNEPVDGQSDDPPRVLVATANIALQEQLLQKDLPMLASVLPWRVESAIAKGRSNFLCLDTFDDSVAELLMEPLRDLDERDRWNMIAAWKEQTATGDLAELPFEVQGKLRSLVATTSDDCTGKSCARYGECWAERMRKKVKRANVVVTNHHLLCAHLALASEFGTGCLPRFDILVVDECFPAGTLVGHTPIERIREGSTVASFDEVSQQLVQRRVVRRFVSCPKAMVRVVVGERTIACTAGHPFYTARGWVPAGSLKDGDLVLSSDNVRFDDGLRGLRQDGLLEKHKAQDASQESGTSVLLGEASGHLVQGASKGSSGQAQEVDRDVLRRLRQVGVRQRDEDVGVGAEGEGLLLTGAFDAPQEGTHRAGSTCHVRGEPSRNLSSNEGSQPHDGSVGSSEDVCDSSCCGASSSYPRRQRKGTDQSSEHARNGAGMAFRGSGSDSARAEEWLPDALQARRRERREDDRDRGGRSVPQRSVGEAQGHEEGGVLAWARVDRVEVLEPGGDGTFGGVCPDGLVYNLEVEGTHTYVAEGFVVHNCHELASISRDFFGFKIREGAFSWATRFLGPKPERARGSSDGYDIDPELRLRIGQDVDDLFKVLKHLRSHPRYFARLKSRVDSDWPMLISNLRKAKEELLKTSMLGASNFMAAQRQEELRRAARRCSILASNVESACDPTTDVDGRWAFFIEEEQRGRVSLCAKPIEVADMLRARVFETPHIRSVICTSATLAVGDGEEAFEFAANDMGATQADEMIVESPFDFQKQALLVVPKNLPDPKKAKEFIAASAELAADVVGMANGRTLVLCTSNAGVKAAAEAIRHRHGERYLVLVQGDAPRSLLVQRFRDDVSSVLVGTRSLWQGVDVSGEALSCVVVDKLPFDPPTDPILDAKSERSERTFIDYSVPRASIALRQGFGRLIRSSTDRGVVVVLDKRLAEKGYGKKILKALPKARFSRDLDDVRRFFAEREELENVGT